MAKRCFPSQRGTMRSANSRNCSSDCVPSIIHNTISACSNLLNVRSIPMLSTVSCVSRIPAVSINLNATPCRSIISSTVSRVVPWISDTRARSSRRRRLRSVDFPAFVSPMIIVGIPFFMAFPLLNESARRLMTCSIWSANATSWVRSANSTSSSLKSNSSSINETNFNNRARKSANSRLNPPRIWFIATRCDAAEVEAIRSATASAWERSRRPLAKARRVNSPGAAPRHPLSIRRSIMRRAI